MLNVELVALEGLLAPATVTIEEERRSSYGTLGGYPSPSHHQYGADDSSEEFVSLMCVEERNWIKFDALLQSLSG